MFCHCASRGKGVEKERKRRRVPGRQMETKSERQDEEEEEIENGDRNGITKNPNYAYADTRSSLLAGAGVLAKDIAIERSSSTICSIDSQLMRSIILSSPPLPYHHSWESVSATTD